MGSDKVLPTIDEVGEGTAIARDNLIGLTEIVAREYLLSQSRSALIWIPFIWDFILFSAINDWEVLTVFIIVSLARIHIAPRV